MRTAIVCAPRASVLRDVITRSPYAIANQTD